MKGVSLTILTSLEELRAIGSEWQQLWRSSGTSPFQSPGWIIPWWEEFHDHRELRVLVFRSGHLLAGVAPFFIDNQRVLLLGSGNTDFLDVVLHPDFRGECLLAIKSALDELPKISRGFDFQQLRACSPLLSLANRSSGEPCPRIDLQNHHRFSEKLDESRKALKKIIRRHDCQFEEAQTDTVREFMAALEDLHRKRWNSKGMSGVLLEPRDSRFLERAALQLCSSEALELLAMRIDGAIVAVVYGLRSGDSTYLFLGGYEPAFENLSLGTVMIGHAIERALDRGDHWLSFLRGQEPYKYRWGAQDEETFRVIGTLS